MAVDLTVLREAARRQMPERRWRHTLGVVDASIELARRYGADAHKAEVAALLHDYAKAWPVERMENIIREQSLPAELLEHDPNLWHAHVGAWAAQHELGIEDEEVLDAIRYHTTGRENMTLLEQIVFLADYIEPGRDYPGVDDVRKLARRNLEEAMLSSLDGTIELLLKRGRRIFPLTILTRNDLIVKLNKENGG